MADDIAMWRRFACLAATLGCLEMLEFFVSEKGANNFLECIHAAIQNGHLGVLKYLVGVWEKVDCKDEEPYEPNEDDEWRLSIDGVSEACRVGCMDVLEYLLEYYDDHFDDSEVWTHMVKALENGHTEAANLMALKWADYLSGDMPRLVREGCSMKTIETVATGKRANEDEFERTAQEAAAYGKLDILKLMVAKGARNFDKCMASAIFEDCSEAVKFLYAQGASNLTQYMDLAAKQGNIEIVRFLAAQGGPDRNDNSCDWDWDAYMPAAVVSGSMDVIMFMVSKGGKAFAECMRVAALHGNMFIVQYMASKGARNFEECMLEAASSGKNMAVLVFLESSGARNFDECMLHAVSLDVIKFMVARGAKKFAECMLRAASRCDLPTIKFMAEQGAHNFAACAVQAAGGEVARYCEMWWARKQLTDVVDFLCQRVAINWDECMMAACKMGYTASARMFHLRGARNGEACALAAAAAGHLNVIKYLDQEAGEGLKNLAQCAKVAAAAGHVHVIKYLLDKAEEGSMNIAECVKVAAASGRLSVIKYLTVWNRDEHRANPTECVLAAAAEGHTAVVNHFLAVNCGNGQCNLHECAKAAVEAANWKAVLFLAAMCVRASDPATAIAVTKRRITDEQEHDDPLPDSKKRRASAASNVL